MRKIIAVILLLTAIIAAGTAGGEDYKVFILCNPDSHVNVRRFPKKGSEITGWLDFADGVWTDGKTKNGYLHVIGITEDGQGWISKGYVVQDKPERVKAWGSIAASGRVMSYRNAGRNKNGWLELLTDLEVYALSEDWAVTSKGYIRRKYLEVQYK